MKKIMLLVAVFFASAFLLSAYDLAATKPVLNEACSGGRITDESGGGSYPISSKYKSTHWLGQIFTADDCGNARLQTLFGGEDGIYSDGSTIWLKSKPTTALRRVLQVIGYTCAAGAAGQCTEWSTNGNLSILKILLLKPYYKSFKQDDCVNCG